MTQQRIKKNLPLISSRTEAEAAMNDLAKAANTKRKLTAKMDAERLAIENKYAADIAVCDTFVKDKRDDLCAWAEANPAEFGKKKSIEFLAGTLGFRTGTPKLALLSRAWNWEKVLAAVMQRAFNFVRSTPEVDKEALLAFYAGASDKAEVEIKVLAPCGVKVVQDESFYVEPKLTDAEVQS